MEENMGAMGKQLSPAEIAEVNKIVQEHGGVKGARYNLPYMTYNGK